MSQSTFFKNLMEGYSLDHQNPFNQKIHKVCVPLIAFSLLGILWAISWEVSLLFGVACLVYYLRLSWKAFLGMSIFVGISWLILFEVQNDVPLLPFSIGIFLLAWGGQFWGHKIEGKKPSFFREVRFLLIGPLWVLKSFGFRF